MRYLIRVTLIIALLNLITFISLAQVELSKDEWQKQITSLTTRKNDLKNKLDGLQGEVDALRKQDAEKSQALKQCQDELAGLVGDESKLLARLNAIDARLDELSKLSNQDLWARRAELDTVQKWINDAWKEPASQIKRNSDRLNNQQARLDALKKSIADIIASGQAMMTYTVGTWAKDRDCLWNIAKKPKIYNNPFLWPKIWQGNRDQIKNPDIIHPGQKLKIPPKADLTKEEKAALKRYWSKKGGS